MGVVLSGWCVRLFEAATGREWNIKIPSVKCVDCGFAPTSARVQRHMRYTNRCTHCERDLKDCLREEQRETRKAQDVEDKAAVERYYRDTSDNAQKPPLPDRIMFKYVPEWIPFNAKAHAIGRVLLDLECLKRLASTTLEIVVGYCIDNEIDLTRVLSQNGLLGDYATDTTLLSQTSTVGKLRRVNHFPKGRRRRLKGFVLEYMAQGLEVNKRYREEEVNSILRSLMQPGFGEDVSTVRRALVETCLLSREMDCSFYWRTKVLPERAPTMYF